MEFNIISTLIIGCFVLYPAIIVALDFERPIKSFFVLVFINATLGVFLASIFYYFASLVALITPIIYSIKNKKGYILSIGIPILLVMINSLLDYGFGSLIYSLYDKNIQELGVISIISVSIYIIEMLLLLGIGMLIRLRINNKFKEVFKLLTMKTNIMIISLLIVTFIIFYTNIIVGRKMGFTKEVINMSIILFFMYFLVALTIIFSLIKSLSKEFEARAMKNDYNNIKEYAINLEILNDDIKKFKHDYINILSSLLGYIDENDLEGLKTYFNNSIIPIGNSFRSNNYRLALLKNIKIQHLKGIISSKIIKAQQLGLDIYIDILDPIYEIKMDSIDLVTVIGIILDNAIEGALESEDKDVKMALIKNKNDLVLLFINSCIKDNPPCYKLFQKGFSTKGEDRGLGLYTLKKITSKYSNVTLETKIDNDEFTQKIVITS